MDELFGDEWLALEMQRLRGIVLAHKLGDFLRTTPESRLSRMSFDDVLRSMAGFRAGPDIHEHTCPKCSSTWVHDGSKAGNEAAHMCPNCGEGPVWARTDGS